MKFAADLCFSAAPNLRCELFTNVQYGVLVIPTCLELIFATVLAITFWNTGRTNLFLAAESCVYLLLVLIESLSNLVPAARENYSISANLDTIVATLSFLPILLYMLFLYLFMRSSFTVALPNMVRHIVQTALVIFIPMIIASSEIASFIGISRLDIANTLALGFNSATDQLLWTFFTSFTLALLSAFQTACFFLAFYRVVRATINQRQIETSGVDAVLLMKGTPWVAGGLVLGTIETFVGFAQCGFASAIIRRIIRLFSRAFLIIGVIKGLDTVEDFKWMEKGKLRLIGKRRRALAAKRRGHTPDFRAPQLPNEVQEYMTPISRAKKGDWVTVHNPRDLPPPPTLLLRFSHLSVTTPSDLELNLAALDSDPTKPALHGSQAHFHGVVPNRGGRGITSTQSPLGGIDDDTSLRPESRFLTVPPLAKTQESQRPPSPMSYYTQTSGSSVISYPVTSAALTTATGKPSTTSVSGRVSSPPATSQQAPRGYGPYGNSFISLSRSNTATSRPPSRPQPALRLVIPPFSWSIDDDQQTPSPLSPRSESDRTLGANNPPTRIASADRQHRYPGPSSSSRTPTNPITDPYAADTSAAWYHSHNRPSLMLGDDRRDRVRIKSIGRVQRRTTPLPTPVHDTRASIRPEQVSSTQMRVAEAFEEGAASEQMFMRVGSLSFPSPPP